MLNKPDSNPPILQFRVALTAANFARSLKFYCDGLGLEPAQVWSQGENQAVLLEMGRATLELFNENRAEIVDQIEAGERLSGPIRLAIQVPDLIAAMDKLIDHGALLEHPPVVTPWGDHNVRPAGSGWDADHAVSNSRVIMNETD